MSFISYAQNGEDVLLWRALQHVENGFYIDVGANDPEQHSVTKAFYQRGWHGINIEPLPSFRAAFLAERPRDLTLSVAAGAAEGQITLFDVPDVNGWASTDAVVAAAHQAEGYAVVEQTVPLRTLAAICREHVDGPVHFLKIDVEGFEGEVLRGMDWSVCRPWIVVVEATLPNSRVSNHASWEQLVAGHGYTFRYFDGLNRYYVADEHAELGEQLTVQANVFDDYISHHLDKAWRQAEAAGQRAAEVHAEAAQAAQRAAEQQAEAAQAAQRAAERLARAQAEAQAEAAQAAQRAADLENALLDARRQTRLAADEAAQLQAGLHQTEQRALAFEAELHRSAAWAGGLEQTLLAMQASSSWRLTAPLRLLCRRGEDSLASQARRRARDAVRRAARWLSSRQALRRLLLPLLARFPATQARVLRTLAAAKGGGGVVQHAPDLPYQLRELPLSARQVLADLRRAHQPTEH